MLKAYLKTGLKDFWQKIIATFKQIGKAEDKPTQTPAAESPNLLSWEEAGEIFIARNHWLQAKDNYQQIDLTNKQADAAILYLEMCEKRYLGLLQEARQNGKRCSFAQCAWCSLTTRRQNHDANFRCMGGAL